MMLQLGFGSVVLATSYPSLTSNHQQFNHNIIITLHFDYSLLFSVKVQEGLVSLQ